MQPNCLRCGQCCTSAVIALDNVKAENDSQELGKWLKFHRCTLELLDMAQGQILGIRIPLTCQHLAYDPDTGAASCTVYDDRPAICREYYCKRASG